jgi:HPt (histidine-containing phosphotransfer) domain-containing protein
LAEDKPSFIRKLPAMAATPVDLTHLARYTGGDRALNAEILRLFDGQVSEMVEQLLGVLEQRDTRKWRQVTHTIKGAARGVGAFAMGEAAAAAEPVDPSLSPDRAILVIEALRLEGQAVQAFIADYLAA